MDPRPLLHTRHLMNEHHLDEYCMETLMKEHTTLDEPLDATYARCVMRLTCSFDLNLIILKLKKIHDQRT